MDGKGAQPTRPPHGRSFTLATGSLDRQSVDRVSPSVLFLIFIDAVALVRHLRSLPLLRLSETDPESFSFPAFPFLLFRAPRISAGHPRFSIFKHVPAFTSIFALIEAK